MLALKKALKGFSRVQLSSADNVYVRHIQAFHVVMNMGCYKITSSFKEHLLPSSSDIKERTKERVKRNLIRHIQ